MLEAIGLILACLDFLKIAEKVETLLGSWHQKLDIFVDVIADSLKNPLQGEGDDAMVSIPWMIVCAIVVGVPTIGVLIFWWQQHFMWQLIIPWIGGVVCMTFVMLVLGKLLNFFFNTILIVLAIFKRAPSGIIGSVGLLIAVVAFVERWFSHSS